MRLLLLHGLFAAALVAAMLAGCSSGGQDGGATSDAGATDGGTNADKDANVDSDGATMSDAMGADSSGGTDSGSLDSGGLVDGVADGGATCLPAVASPGTGHHNPGADCATGCHDGTNAGAPVFTVSGTLYATASGAVAIAGATIEIVDATNAILALPTYDDGNFYTLQAVTFPLKVRASKCPIDSPMMATSTTGNCNSAGCHATSTSRIHL